MEPSAARKEAAENSPSQMETFDAALHFFATRFGATPNRFLKATLKLLACP